MLKMEVHLDTEGHVLLSLDHEDEVMVIQLSRRAAGALCAKLQAACQRAETVEALLDDVASIVDAYPAP